MAEKMSIIIPKLQIKDYKNIDIHIKFKSDQNFSEILFETFNDKKRQQNDCAFQ